MLMTSACLACWACWAGAAVTPEAARRRTETRAVAKDFKAATMVSLGFAMGLCTRRGVRRAVTSLLPG